LLEGDSLEGAIAATVAYFDVFAFAPDASEIHRFLLGRRASRRDVESLLMSSPELVGVIGSRDGLYFLRGKDHLSLRRMRFVVHSQRLWEKARRIARMIERSRLAAAGMVTGSLATDSADEHADIDFLFIYPADRTWTSFAAVRLIAKLPGLRGLCANYVLSDAQLEVKPQNLFTALEIAKAVPMFGFDVYRCFIAANGWVLRFLPNAFASSPIEQSEANGCDPRFIQGVLRTKAFRMIESWEKRRKHGKDRRDVGVDMEERERRGSMDRHSPTRSMYALSELRYRMELLGLEAHPLFRDIERSTLILSGEMKRWGRDQIAPSGRRPSEQTAHSR
jgi:hypothetical protein